VFGEILPKSLSLPHNTWVAQRIAGIIDSASKVLTILRRPITALTHGLSQLFLIFLPKEAEVTREELKHVLGSSAKGGMLLQQEAKLMGGALELQKLPVKEVMRPREEMLFYDIQDPIDRLYHLLVESETTRVPVCDGSLENLLGVITTRRLFLEPQKLTTGKQLIPLLKKPFYIPEVSKAWELLQLLRSTHESLAIVVDEYGSIAGLITQEDLIEIVVGEISDKRDAKDRYTLSGSDVMIASGKLTLSEFADVFGVSLTSEAGAQTLGGWMIEQLGEIPVSGTKMTHGPFLFYVLAAEPHRIRRIYVRRIG
jgi:CBS domain containing-hemolysin-like protein